MGAQAGADKIGRMTEPEPTAADSAAPATASARRRRGQRPRPRTSVIGVLGEVLITVGVLVLLFLGWQVWWNSLILSNAQASAASTQSRLWLEQSRATPDATPAPGAAEDGTKDGTPPVMKPVADYQPFAVIYAPRLGADWRRVIRETVSVPEVLNSETSGVGHYTGTQMPGQVGNFAIAGHVNGYGNAFIDVHRMHLGDKIYIETKDGWYTYSFRDFEYVQPDAVAVLLPVPREPNLTPTDRIMTLTTCNPPWHSGERLVAYSTFDSWQPLSAGPPAAIAAHVAAAGGK